MIGTRSALYVLTVVSVMVFAVPLGLQGTHQVLKLYLALVCSQKKVLRNWLRTCRSVQISVQFGLVDILNTARVRRENIF